MLVLDYKKPSRSWLCLKRSAKDSAYFLWRKKTILPWDLYFVACVLGGQPVPTRASVVIVKILTGWEIAAVLSHSSFPHAQKLEFWSFLKVISWFPSSTSLGDPGCCWHQSNKAVSHWWNFLGANISAMSVISSFNEIVLENSLSGEACSYSNLLVLSSLIGVL